jgi:hypothetical protein
MMCDPWLQFAGVRVEGYLKAEIEAELKRQTKKN